MLERLMEEIKGRTLVVRIFPNAAACLRLIRALAVEIREDWIEAMQYLNMEPLKEPEKRRVVKVGRRGVMVTTVLTRARRSNAALALVLLPASKVQSV
jgi:hypothetical protein